MSGKGRRVESNSAEAMIPVSDIEATIQPIIQKAIDAATKVLRTEFMKLLDERVTQLEQTVNTLSTEYMKVDITALEERVAQLEQTVTVSGPVSIDELRKDKRDAKLWANENEQYSRRANIRIKGMVLPDECDYRQEVVNFFKMKLNIQNIGTQDIEAAHPVRSRRPTSTNTTAREGTSRPTEPVILVCFCRKQQRDEVLRQRRILKGTRISIGEDLTTLNVQTMNRAKNNSAVSKTWSWNGKVYALLAGRKVVVKPYQPIQETDEI